MDRWAGRMAYYLKRRAEIFAAPPKRRQAPLPADEDDAERTARVFTVSRCGMIDEEYRMSRK